jgi:hypothetical protein
MALALYGCSGIFNKYNTIQCLTRQNDAGCLPMTGYIQAYQIKENYKGQYTIYTLLIALLYDLNGI